MRISRLAAWGAALFLTLSDGTGALRSTTSMNANAAAAAAQPEMPSQFTDFDAFRPKRACSCSNCPARG